MDKPSLPSPADPSFGEKVKQCIERIMGRRGSKVTKLTGLNAQELTSAPTAADYNTLRTDLDTLRVRFNALLDQVEDT